ncbi:hypothetical protein [Labilibaculum sp.]|uniref:hypothetical protein n=1 Tax=Labilibaculum sp. TaxID=2060723 RepID=UPI002AA82B0D|nr:hypothetical protein [Labilibaculum sp.]
MKKTKVIRIVMILIVLVFIVLSNIFSFVYIALIEPQGIYKTYQFETYDGKHEFITMPHKGTDVATMEYRFELFQNENPEYKGTKLYRTFGRNPLKYWRWYEFVTHNRYKYPFKESGKVI